MDITTINRTMYEHLRLSLIKANLLVDITKHTTQATYEQAAKQLKQSNGYNTVVDLYGVGRGRGRYEKKNAMITIDGKSISKHATYNAGGAIMYEKKTDGNYIKKRLPKAFYDMQYEVRTYSTSGYIEQLLSMAIINTYANQQYVHTIDKTGNTTKDYILLIFNGSANYTDYNVAENLYRYTVSNVNLEQSEILDSNVVNVKKVISGVDAKLTI